MAFNWIHVHEALRFLLDVFLVIIGSAGAIPVWAFRLGLTLIQRHRIDDFEFKAVGEDESFQQGGSFDIHSVQRQGLAF